MRKRHGVKMAVITAAIALSGCGARQLIYTPQIMDAPTARVVIEQVLLEQNPKYRPEGVEFTPDYIQIYEGYSSRSRGTNLTFPNTPIPVSTSDNRSLSRQLSTRIYYTSLGELRLYHKNNHYVMRPMSKDGQIMHTAYAFSDAKARQYLDAIHTLSTTAQ